MSRPTLRWTALAIAGLIIVAGITLAVSRLVSQPIGLSSEPITAGDRLAPVITTPARVRRPPTRPRAGTQTGTTPPSRTVTRPPAPAPAPSRGISAPPSTAPVTPAPRPREPSDDLVGRDRDD